MNRLNRLSLSALALTMALGTRAQGPFAPTMGAWQFSDGVHPVISALFPEADLREVQSFWKAELSTISIKVTGKKEMIGMAARIPAASADTMRILIAVEQRKGEKAVIAQLAFRTTAGYVAPDSPERERDACLEWVQQRSLVLLRQLARKRLDQGQRELDQARRQWDLLKREHDRSEAQLQRTRQRAANAEKEKQAADSTLALPAPLVQSADSAQASVQAKEAEKTRQALTKKSQRAAYVQASSVKKADDLGWAIKKNLEEQTAKEAEVKQLQEKVNTLKSALDGIR
jgi:hypothetical protein